MPRFNRMKRRGPSPKEQANWDNLFAAEKEKQKRARQEEDRKLAESTRRRLDQFRNF